MKSNFYMYEEVQKYKPMLETSAAMLEWLYISH